MQFTDPLTGLILNLSKWQNIWEVKQLFCD